MALYSLLDLVPVMEGGSVAQALRNAADLARQAEAAGYHRYWVAEHHGNVGLAGGATAVVLGHVAAATRTIRVGAGGVMLPNHAPLVIAEQFGTLEALFPGRIDLGLGRAHGSIGGPIARALQRTMAGGANDFPREVLELQSYFADDGRTGVTAIPGAAAEVETWILGSSLYGAKLAAMLGLPYAFASHFAPDALDQALATYRREFRPSARLAQPYAMASFNVFAAETDAEAELLASSHQQSFIALHSGHLCRLPAPVVGYRESLPPAHAAILDHVLPCSAVGNPATVARELGAFVERTGVDEVMVTSMIYDHEARKRSIAIAAAAVAGMKAAA